MAHPTTARIRRRFHTAASLPRRVVAVEDRTSAIEEHVAKAIEEMRSELAEIRDLLSRALDADADATELVGRLLSRVTERLEILEGEHEARNDTSP